MANCLKEAAINLVESNGSTRDEPTELKFFTKGDSEHPGFKFFRYWWEGKADRTGVEPWVRKKLRPGDDPRFGHASKHEVLIPDGTPTEYADLDFLLKRFDDTLPSFEKHAFIQVKLALDPGWTASYERVRAFARGYFAQGLHHPLILIAHVPTKASLGNAAHVHCVVLSRPLTLDGLGPTNHPLCSDRGYEETLNAWRRYVAEYE